MSKQTLEGDVGQAIQADVVHNAPVISNGNIVINHAHRRPLTRDERRTLNNLVKQLDEEFGESGRQTWTAIHRILGTDNIEVMHLEQFRPAEAILQLLIENATLRARLRADEVAALQAKLDQSASALTTLTAQSGERAARVRKLEGAYSSLEGKYQQQSRELREALDNARAAQERGSGPAPPCRQCDTARAAISRSRRATILSCLLAVVSVPMAAYFAYQTIRKGAAVQVAEAKLKVCEYNGKSYGLGSIVDSPGTADLECALASGAAAPQWKTIKSSGVGSKKSAVTRRRAQREDGELTKLQGNLAPDAVHVTSSLFAEQ